VSFLEKSKARASQSFQKKRAALTKRLETLRAEVGKSESELRVLECKYLHKHPLSDAIKTRLVADLRAGKALCCGDGLAYLKTIVDPLWAEKLNEWAYERLGCKGSAVRDWNEYANKLLVLFEDDDYPWSKS
jgi:hypothetical protein